MQFNYYFLKKIVSRLQILLESHALINCFSQNRNELVFEFEHLTQKKSFYVKAQLDGEVSLISFPESFARAKKNSVALFPEAIGQNITKIKQFLNERSFAISLTKHTLVFKLHGRRSNILLFEGERLISLFKNSIVNDKSIKIESLDRSIDQSPLALRDSEYNLREHFPTFDKNILQWLNERSFESLTSLDKESTLSSLLAELNDDSFYIKEFSNGYKLLLIRPEEPYEVFEDPIDASNTFTATFHRHYHTTSLKSKLVSRLNKEINKTKSYLSKNRGKLDQLTKGRKYEELANILMANLHVSILPQQSSITLFDFYQNENISIKIKKNASLQETASNYYKKSKNQSKEIENLSNNIGVKEKLLASLNSHLDTLADNLSVVELKKLNQELFGNTNTKQQEEFPFMEFDIDGYTLWLGRNAKNNDLLTQSYAKKNDLWLHAKDVSGSHAVIKSNGNDKYPIRVIERAASLVAWHSKRKNDTLCPVLYTLKKYVRKPKGALPGQVIVTQEDVVLVKPNRTIPD